MRRLTRIALGAALAATLTQPALTQPAAAQDTIKIGELNSYKAVPAFLEPYKKGWELAVEEINAAGGIGGRTAIPDVLAESTALVNNMRAGAPDKVVYEACAACRPVIVSNPLFDELLDDLQPSLRFDVDDVGQLAARIMAVGALEVGERDRLGRTLRERVLERHSAASWADAVVRLCGR